MLFLKFTISRKFQERLNLVTISTHSNLSLSHGVYDFNLNYLDDRFCNNSYTPLPIPHRAPPTTRRKPHLHLRLSIKDPSPPNPKTSTPSPRRCNWPDSPCPPPRQTHHVPHRPVSPSPSSTLFLPPRWSRRGRLQSSSPDGQQPCFSLFSLFLLNI